MQLTGASARAQRVAGTIEPSISPGGSVVLAVLFILTSGLIASGSGALLRILFPTAAVGVGAVLFFRYPSTYVLYTWLLWFLTPLVRRLVDYQAGWDPINPVLVAPVLVTGLSMLTVVRKIRSLRSLRMLPFVLAGTAILYAFPIGLFDAGLSAASYNLLLWLTPICFGCHLAVHQDGREAQWRATRTAFTLGLVVVGVYGVSQYLAPQPWDAYWMINSEMGSIGRPEPQAVRVFSTLNAPAPCGIMLFVGLLALLTARTTAQWVAGVPGYVALSLTLVRTAWLAWGVGMLLYWAYATRRTRVKVLIAASGLLVLAAPLLGTKTANNVLAGRLRSIGATDEDASYQARVTLYARFFDLVNEHPWGEGFGVTGSSSQLTESGVRQEFDSGLLELFRTLGWPGAAAFLAGIAALFAQLLPRGRSLNQEENAAARAVVLSVLACMLSLNTMVGVAGMMFWGFAGLFVRGSGLSSVVRPLQSSADFGTPRVSGLHRRRGTASRG